jgi:hypothetical protein
MKIKLVDMQEQARRQERKNRDVFRKMLEEHVADGTITARTWWRDYCAQVHGIFSVTNKQINVQFLFLLFICYTFADKGFTCLLSSSFKHVWFHSKRAL